MSAVGDSNRRDKRSSLHLPRAPPTNRYQSPIPFGSLNQPSETDSQTTSTYPNVVHTTKPNGVTFGSISVTDPSSQSNVIPPKVKQSMQYSSPTSQARSPPKSNLQPIITYSHNPGNRHPNTPRTPYNHNKSSPRTYPDSPGMAQGSYSPNTYWTSGNHWHNQSPYYPYNASPNGTPRTTPAASKPRNCAIPIINPETGTQVNPGMPVVNSPAPSKETFSSEDKKQQGTFKFESKSRAIQIVDPAIKEREEREKREREEMEKKKKAEEEEAARKAKEEEERKVKEEAERKVREEEERRLKEEEERRIKEETERKAKEEAERKAQEEEKRKAQEEAERKAKEEEEERMAKEEAERKAKEEAELKSKAEADLKAKEEAELKSKTEADLKAKESQPSEETEYEATETAESATSEKDTADMARNKDRAEDDQTPSPRTSTSPEGRGPRHVPNRLDLSAIPSHVFDSDVTQSPSSARPKSARLLPKISDFSTIKYPDTVSSPPGSAGGGRIRYETEFLLAFQSLCKETDVDLTMLQNNGDDVSDRSSRSGSQRRLNSERGRGPRTPNSPMEMGMFRHGSRDGRMDGGKFGGRALSSRSASGHGMSGLGSPGIQREGSHGGRSRSGRGNKGRHQQKDQGPTIPLDQVVPLEKSENRWVPTLMTSAPTPTTTEENDLIPQDVIIRKVKSLLNKLTMEKFDSISNQIWDYAYQSSKEEDGQSLRTVIQLIFEKACDEPQFAGMWAQLCRKLFDLMDEHGDIKDTTILDSQGKPVAGALLYRKYLLNRCQQEFERGWKFNLPKPDEQSGDVMMTDEYYAAVKAKRQGLGLVQLIGELFKRKMLTDRIMIECFRRLSQNYATAEDEEAETMCKLMTTIGKDLDTSSRKNREYMDTFMKFMEEMQRSPNLTGRVKFMILDVFDLRKNKWISRSKQPTGPTTISQIREEAQKQKAEEKDAMKRQSSSRGRLSRT